MRTLFKLLVVILLFYSCDQETQAPQTFDVNIRMERDPGRINPFYAPTSLGREVYQYIFTPLADYHPENLELYPILIEEIPETIDTVINDEPAVAYTLDLLDDAEWSDGTKISAKDYYFTVQMVKHPNSKISAWKPYFEPFKGVELDEEDDTRLTVYMDPDYMLSKEVAVSVFLLPHHVFDSTGVLIAKDLIDASYATSDSSEIKLVENVNSSVNQKEEIVQVGPYQISDYQTDEYIVLQAKEDYWGNKYEDRPSLHQNPDKIIFRMVPDELAAINMAKESKLDFIRLKSSKLFLDLQEDEGFSSEYGFHLPQIMQYYYLAMNNKDEILSSKNVRKALSHLTDVDDIIENIDGGLGLRTTGHFNPKKSYYNTDIQAVDYSLDKAKELLAADAWEDSNNDGTLDKDINGSRTELELELLITGSSLSQNIALLFQESAKQAGVKVNIVNKQMSLIRKENLSNFNFDMAALAATADANPDDPYSRWHSDNAVPGKQNQIGYSNSEADALIEEIRTTRDVEKRADAYRELQEIMHEDQPCIFLYSPMQKIIISKRLDAVTSSKRPGYSANSFKLAE